MLCQNGRGRRTVTTGCDSSGVSHKRKDIPSGESARRGNAPSVDGQNGQYRASRMRGDEQDLRRGKKG